MSSLLGGSSQLLPGDCTLFPCLAFGLPMKSCLNSIFLTGGDFTLLLNPSPCFCFIIFLTLKSTFESKKSHFWMFLYISDSMFCSFPSVTRLRCLKNLNLFWRYSANFLYEELIKTQTGAQNNPEIIIFQESVQKLSGNLWYFWWNSKKIFIRRLHHEMVFLKIRGLLSKKTISAYFICKNFS